MACAAATTPASCRPSDRPLCICSADCWGWRRCASQATGWIAPARPITTGSMSRRQTLGSRWSREMVCRSPSVVRMSVGCGVLVFWLIGRMLRVRQGGTPPRLHLRQRRRQITDLGSATADLGPHGQPAAATREYPAGVQLVRQGTRTPATAPPASRRPRHPSDSITADDPR